MTETGRKIIEWAYENGFDGVTENELVEFLKRAKKGEKAIRSVEGKTDSTDWDSVISNLSGRKRSIAIRERGLYEDAVSLNRETQEIMLNQNFLEVSRFSKFWRLSEEEAVERLEQLGLEVENGRISGYIKVRQEFFTT